MARKSQTSLKEDSFNLLSNQKKPDFDPALPTKPPHSPSPDIQAQNTSLSSSFISSYQTSILKKPNQPQTQGQTQIPTQTQHQHSQIKQHSQYAKKSTNQTHSPQLQQPHKYESQDSSASAYFVNRYSSVRNTQQKNIREVKKVMRTHKSLAPASRSHDQSLHFVKKLSERDQGIFYFRFFVCFFCIFCGFFLFWVFDFCFF